MSIQEPLQAGVVYQAQLPDLPQIPETSPDLEPASIPTSAGPSGWSRVGNVLGGLAHVAGPLIQNGLNGLSQMGAASQNRASGYQPMPINYNNKPPVNLMNPTQGNINYSNQNNTSPANVFKNTAAANAPQYALPPIGSNQSNNNSNIGAVQNASGPLGRQNFSNWGGTLQSGGWDPGDGLFGDTSQTYANADTSLNGTIDPKAQEILANASRDNNGNYEIRGARVEPHIAPAVANDVASIERNGNIASPDHVKISRDIHFEKAAKSNSQVQNQGQAMKLQRFPVGHPGNFYEMLDPNYQENALKIQQAKQALAQASKGQVRPKATRAVLHIPGLQIFKDYPTNPNLPHRYYPDITHNVDLYTKSMVSVIQEKMKLSKEVIKASSSRPLMFGEQPGGTFLAAVPAYVDIVKEAAQNMREGHIWDLKQQPGIPPSENHWGLLKGQPVNDMFVANYAFGQVTAALGLKLEDSLQIAQTYTQVTDKKHRNDQPQDQAAVVSGWNAYHTGNPWPAGLKTPAYYDRLNKENQAEYERLRSQGRY